jgi:hypothetical protein
MIISMSGKVSIKISVVLNYVTLEVLEYTLGLGSHVSRIENSDLDYIDHVILEAEDIQRHPAVKEVLGLYEDHY